MRIRCPHCRNPMEVVQDAELSDLSCPSCGSGFSLLSDVETISQNSSTFPTIAHFRLIEKVGVGAYGSVWKAHDTELDRIVAVKLPRNERLDESETEQFLREARSAAQLKHPGIVAVHEVGRENGQVFLVSDFVEGVSLASWLTAERPSMRESVAICVSVAESLHHAHEAGVIHRDLKPSNIMLDASSKPLIMDFGLAKRMAGEITMTVEGQVLGTPAYMPPEQARGQGHHADRRSDVYSLGAVLFELLTGERPFRGDARMLLHQVQREEPPSPRKLNSQIPPDLETICLKCLEKDPAQRFQTAQDLADELQRFLEGRPIQSRPVGQTARLWRWCKRNPMVASLVASICVVLLAGIISTTSFAVLAQRRAEKNEQLTQIEKASREKAEQAEANANRAAADAKQHAKDADKQLAKAIEAELLANAAASQAMQAAEEANQQRARADAETIKVKNQEAIALENHKRAEWLLYKSQIQLAQFAWEQNNIALATESLANTRSDLRGWEFGYLQRLLRSEFVTLRRHPYRVLCLAYSPDGRQIANGNEDGTLRVLDSQSGRASLTVKSHVGSVTCIAFSPDGKRIVSGSSDNTLKVHDAVTGETIVTLTGHEAPVTCAAFSPTGELVASASQDKTIRIWEAATGLESRVLGNNEGFVYALAFSPDGKSLATGDFRMFKLWDLASFQILRTFSGHAALVFSLAFRNDGERIVSGSPDRTLMIWDVETGEDVFTLEGHQDTVASVAFSPDGKQILSGSFDKTLRLWDAETGKETKLFKGHNDRVMSVAFHPDGKHFASASYDRTIKVWGGKSDSETLHIPGDFLRFTGLAFHPDSRSIVTASMNQVLTVWHAETGQPLRTLKGNNKFVGSVALSPDGKRILGGGADLKIWNAETGELIQTLEPNDLIFSIAVSPNGRLIAAALGDKTIQIWDAETVQEKHVLKGHLNSVYSLAFNPDGTQLISGSGDRTLRLWDLETGEALRVFQGHQGSVHCVAYSPDGACIISGSWDRTLISWDAQTGERIRLSTGHGGKVNSLAFSPDGKRIASGGEDRMVIIWDTTTGEAVLSLKGHVDNIRSVAFSPDGSRMASGCYNAIKVWDASEKKVAP